MRVRIVEGAVTALRPLHHGGDEKTGSTPVLRTVTCYVEGQGQVPIPFVSGNSVRGRLRRLVMKDMLDSVGYELQNPKVHHALFSGGILETTEDKKDEGVIDLAFRRAVRDALPPAAVFGCALGNQMIQGILIVEHLWPICEETAPNLPERFRKDERARLPVRAFCDQSFITRRDDLRAEREEDEQAVQMKVDYECFSPGARFYHRFALSSPNALEESCLGHVIGLWRQSPYIGGRSSSGDGKLRLDYDEVPDPAPYQTYLREAAADVRRMLKELEARL